MQTGVSGCEGCEEERGRADEWPDNIGEQR